MKSLTILGERVFAPRRMSPEETARFIKAEVSRWAAIVKDTGAKGE